MAEGKSRNKSKKNKVAENFIGRVSFYLDVVLKVLRRVALGLLQLAIALWLLSLLNWHQISELIDFRLLLDYLKTLVWPAVVLIVLTALAPQIRDILKRGFELGFGGAKLKVEPSQQPSAPAPAAGKVAEEVNEAPTEAKPDAASGTLPNISMAVTTVPQTREEILEDAYKNPEIKWEFEKVYRTSYGTQIEVLLLLETFLANGLKSDALKPYYEQHLKKRSNLTIPVPTFQQYMGYLINSHLVNYDPGTDIYQLNPVGELFLRYLREQNIALPALKSL